MTHPWPETASWSPEDPGGDPATGRSFLTRPARAATLYNHWTGGKDNFSGDRDTARLIARKAPWAQAGAAASRAWLQHQVAHLAQTGIRQFIDLGCGLPADPGSNIHEIARTTQPGARVLYVDNDLIVLAHAHALLADDSTQILDSDLTRPQQIIDHLRSSTSIIDLSQPTAVLMSAVLHCIPAEYRPENITAAFATRAAAEIYMHATGTPFIPRTPAEVTALFTGFTLNHEPTLLTWADQNVPVLAAVAIKPEPGPHPDDGFTDDAP